MTGVVFSSSQRKLASRGAAWFGYFVAEQRSEESFDRLRTDLSARPVTEFILSLPKGSR
jgi:hypothetical protein